jgi:hypothetical protein
MRAADFCNAPDEGPGHCFACGQQVRAGAVWQGAGAVVWLCRSCAEFEPQPLAALIADAIADQANGGPACHRLSEALRRFEGQAWRALALALERR